MSPPGASVSPWKDTTAGCEVVMHRSLSSQPSPPQKCAGTQLHGAHLTSQSLRRLKQKKEFDQGQPGRLRTSYLKIKSRQRARSRPWFIFIIPTLPNQKQEDCH